MLKVMLLGMLGLSGTHTAYPVIVQTKKLAHEFWIDTSAGSELIDAVRRVQHRSNLPDIAQTNLRTCAGDR